MRTLQCTVPAAFDGRPLKHLLRGELGISSTLLKTLKWREGAILLNGAVIGRHCIVGAGALVTQNTVIPDGSLVYGSPARVKGQLDEAAITDIRRNAVDYRREAAAWFPEYGDK